MIGSGGFGRLSLACGERNYPAPPPCLPCQPPRFRALLRSHLYVKRIANAALTKVGAEFDAILASNDGTAGGAIQALIEEGLAGKKLVPGQDAERSACQRIVAGTQTMTIYKPLKALAKLGADAAVKLARRQVVVANASVNNGTLEVPAHHRHAGQSRCHRDCRWLPHALSRFRRFHNDVFHSMSETVLEARGLSKNSPGWSHSRA